MTPGHPPTPRRLLPRRRFLAGLAAVPAIAAGCGSSPTAAPGADPGDATGADGGEVAELATSPSADSTARLVELAREAGPVLVYTSNPPEEFQRLTAEFTKEYGVRVKTYRAGGTNLVQRVLQETRAKSVTADAISANDNVVYALDVGEGLVRPFTSAEADKLPAELRVSKNSYPVYVNYWMWAYNTRLLKKSDLPHSYADLLDPRWKGKFTIAQYPDWLATIFEIVDDPDAHFDALRGQRPMVADQFTQAIIPVVSGEYPLTITTTSGVLANQTDDGAPLAGYFPDDATPARSQSVAWLSGGANPAGGLLFAEFQLAPRYGQRFMREANRVPAHADVPPDPPELRPAEFRAVDYAKFLPQQAAWEERFDTLVAKR